MSINKNKLTQEEQLLRDKLNEVDFHFQEADWKAIEGKVSGSKWANYNTYIKVAATLVTLSGLVYFISQEMSPQTEVVQNKQEQLSPSKQTSSRNKAKSSVDQAKKATEDSNKEVVEKSSTTNSGELIVKEDQEHPIVASTQARDSSEPSVQEETTENPIDPTKVQHTNEVEPAFKLALEGKLCEGEEITLSAQSDNHTLDDSYTLRWKINGKRLIQQNPVVKYELDKTGNYKVQLSIKNKQGKLLDNLEQTFSVNALPEINFTYEDGAGIFDDYEVVLKPNPNSLNYRWFLDDEEIRLDKANSYRFNDKGVYSMRMVYESESACVVELEKPIAVMKDFGPFANAFTPNNDGKNEEFMPHGFDEHKGFFQFIVLDLSGKVVFESKSPHEKWNGKLHNTGAELPEGQYIWKLSVADEKGNKRSFSDRVKLLYFN